MASINNRTIDVTAIMQELRELRQRLDDAPQPSIQPDSTPSAKIQKEPARQISGLKATSLPIYDGDRSTYPAWRKAVLDALGMDWNTFGYTNKMAFLLIYKALDGRAKKQAGAHYESGGPDGLEDPEGFIKFLDQTNWDTTRVARARTELNALKMGPKQRWSSFFSMWTNKLTESRGDNWPDETKITMLRGALNHTLRVALANNYGIPLDNFVEWTRIVSQIALQHDELAAGPQKNQDLRSNEIDFQKNSQNMSVSTNSKNEISRSGREYGYAGEVDSAGDTFMGGVNLAEIPKGPKGKPLRAKWKTPSQIEALRRDGRCFRCERKGCNTRVCKVLPAKKPHNAFPVVNLASLPDILPGVCFECEDEEQDESLVISEN